MIVTTVTVCRGPRACVHAWGKRSRGTCASISSSPHDDPCRFLLYEAYESSEASARHKETEHYARWRDTVTGWMAKPREGVPHRVIRPLERSAW